MLTGEQLSEIKSHLEKAQNPVFFFDNDVDGLCAFLVLQRYFQKGKGVAIKSFPELTEDYFRKVHELNADYIFILDKPFVSKEFFEEVEKYNVPVVWIDHHDVPKPENLPEIANYYNPFFNEEKSNEPTTYLCYKATRKKEDLWLAVVGCIFDKYVPDFYEEFIESFPELAIESDNAFEIRYNSQIGKLVMILSFALKDRTTNVINMLKFLMHAKSPYDVLEENTKNYTMHRRFSQINSKCQKFLEKAKSTELSGNLLYFQYSGDMSISSDLADELNFLFPDKIIVVVYVAGIKANVSSRGDNVREILLNAIEDFEDATGGGHRDAAGAQVRTSDLERFRLRLEEFVNNNGEQ